MKITVINWNDIIPNMSDVFTVYHHPTEIRYTDALIISDDTTFMGVKACKIAKEYGVPSFIVQHGRNAATDYSVHRKEIIADFFFAWGHEDVEQAVEGGWARDRVIRIGCPALVDRCTPEPDGKTVVFAPPHREQEDDVNKRNSEEGMAIWEVLHSMDGIHPIAKLLKYEHDFKHYPHEKFITWRLEEGHIKRIYQELLRKTSCVVSPMDGTFELLAYSMDIPVVKLESNCPAASSPAARLVYTIDEIEGAVRDALAHPEWNREERKRIVVERGWSEGDNPKESIARLIKEKTKRELYVNKR